jgi:hypothetical protein
MSLFQRSAPGMVRVNRPWPFTAAGSRSPHASKGATDKQRKAAMKCRVKNCRLWLWNLVDTKRVRLEK